MKTGRLSLFDCYVGMWKETLSINSTIGFSKGLYFINASSEDALFKNWFNLFDEKQKRKLTRKYIDSDLKDDYNLKDVLRPRKVLIIGNTSSSTSRFETIPSVFASIQDFERTEIRSNCFIDLPNQSSYRSEITIDLSELKLILMDFKKRVRINVVFIESVENLICKEFEKKCYVTTEDQEWLRYQRIISELYLYAQELDLKIVLPMSEKSNIDATLYDYFKAIIEVKANGKFQIRGCKSSLKL